MRCETNCHYIYAIRCVCVWVCVCGCRAFRQYLVLKAMRSFQIDSFWKAFIVMTQGVTSFNWSQWRQRDLVQPVCVSSFTSDHVAQTISYSPRKLFHVWQQNSHDIPLSLLKCKWLCLSCCSVWDPLLDFFIWLQVRPLWNMLESLYPSSQMSSYRCITFTLNNTTDSQDWLRWRAFPLSLSHTQVSLHSTGLSVVKGIWYNLFICISE